MVKQPKEVESEKSERKSSDETNGRKVAQPTETSGQPKVTTSSGQTKKTAEAKKTTKATSRTVNDVKKPAAKTKKKTTTIRTDNIAEAEIIEPTEGADDHVKTLGEIAAERERREQAKKAEAEAEAEESPKGQPKKLARVKRAMPFFFRVIFSVLLLAGLSILLTWYIFWRSKLNDVDKTWDFINNKPMIFTYSCLIVFLAMAVIASVTWRVFLTAGLSFVIASVLMYANAEKLAVRAAPILPEDLQLADQVGVMTNFVDMNDVTRLIGGIVLLMVGVCLLEHYLRRWIGKDTKPLPYWQKVTIVPRITFTLMSIAALIWAMSPIMRHPGTNSYSIDWLGAKFEAWHQVETYNNNGFIIAFVYNLGTTEIEKPADYSKERVKEILAKYESIKAKEDEDRKDIADVVDNIVFVLSESFYDPNLLSEKYPYTGSDLIPAVHEAMASGLGGYMYSPEYGGGTANIEFEAYTELSNYWSNAMPYVDYVSKISDMPGLVQFAKQNGYETTAIHAYNGTMYKRDFVYPNMGFNTFIDIDDFTYTERETPTSYINDWSIYQEALDILDSDEPQMVGLITMQGHAGFNCGVAEDRTIEVPGNAYLTTDYTCLYKADQYLGEFLEELKKSDERTVVLWFGDHAAGVLHEYALSSDKSMSDLAHLTPYFVWANFKLDNLYSTKEVAKINSANGFDYAKILTTYWATTPARKKEVQTLINSITLPTVTPNCMTNILYDALNVKKPALSYLVGEVCETVPILTTTYLKSETPADSAVLREYQIVNYDILNGDRYWLK